jgi:PadR family transcriptional regulator, regulatory protein PadR
MWVECLCRYAKVLPRPRGASTRHSRYVDFADSCLRAGARTQRTTEDVLQVEHGSLYLALHRLERKGWISAQWELAGKDLKREFKYYRLTAAGKKQLLREESKWKRLADAISRVMWPAEEQAK